MPYSVFCFIVVQIGHLGAATTLLNDWVCDFSPSTVEYKHQDSKLLAPSYSERFKWVWKHEGISF